ncbi:hypothetical protein [Nocardia sp. CC227C]|uniref:hypothetical protein n=1 Tax=Nocardia sp. CC227C TaxID=3044562 RepID=UPI00278C6BC8|nr:hypothetical protein [Nocardia sp. CC227C]
MTKDQTPNPFVLGGETGLPAYAGMPDLPPAPAPEPEPAKSAEPDPDYGGPAASITDNGDSWGQPANAHYANNDDELGPAASVTDRGESWNVSTGRGRHALPDPEDEEFVYGAPNRAVDPVLGADTTGVDPPAPIPAKVAAHTGNWDEWLAGPARGRGTERLPRATAARTDDEPDTRDDDTGDSGYSATARRSVVDRTGRIKPVLGRLTPRREHDDYEGTRSRGALVAVATVGAAALLIGVIVAVNVNLGDAANTAAVTSTVTLVPASTDSAAPVPENYPHATDNCFATRTDTAVVGAGPGDPATAAGAILAFEWAYYVDRNAARAREHVAADAAVPDTATIQAGIDEVPDGTRYCVFLTRADADGHTWQVELHEQYPSDPEPQRYAQIITTRTDGERALITAISKR